MKILLCYSLIHFNPELSEEEHPYWGSSTNILARSLYKILSEIGTVTYIDERSIDQFKGQYFDLIIGTIGSFRRLSLTVNSDIKIIFNAQMHPIERVLMFLRFIHYNKLYKNNTMNWGELLEVPKAYSAIGLADYLLGVGNTVTQNSFVKFGINRCKLKLLNYGLLDNRPSTINELKVCPEINLIYFATDIGLRKGFDIICDLFENNTFSAKNYVLHVVGTISNNFYLDKISLLEEELGERFRYHGWIRSNSVEYTNMLRMMDVLLYPSLEEGQAGTVIDCISRGIVPILSKNTGIDFSPLGFFELELKNKNNLQLIKEVIGKSDTELLKLKRLTTQYYNEFHSNFYQVIRSTIFDAINNNLYPKISIIYLIGEQHNLKIYLQSLRRSLIKYQNLEIFLIFNNVRDNQTTRFRKYFEQNNGRYKVHIFEFLEYSEVESINSILLKTNGKYVLLLHDASIFTNENFLFDSANFLDKNASAAILGIARNENNINRSINGKSTSIGRINVEKEMLGPIDANGILEVDSFFGETIILRKSIFEEDNFLNSIGNLENAFLDLCKKEKYRGNKVYCHLQHFGRSSPSEFFDRRNLFGISCLNRKTNLFFSLIEFLYLIVLPLYFFILKRLSLKMHATRIFRVVKK